METGGEAFGNAPDFCKVEDDGNVGLTNAGNKRNLRIHACSQYDSDPQMWGKQEHYHLM